jgi:hypothetical protein
MAGTEGVEENRPTSSPRILLIKRNAGKTGKN